MKIVLTLLLSFGFFFVIHAQCTPPEGDNDGDGVVDAVDLDDDNDGILDLEETGRGSINWSIAQLNNFRATAFSAPMECATLVGFQCNPLVTQLTSFTYAPTAVNNVYQTMLRADINNPSAILPYTMQFTANSTAANTAYGNITLSLTPGTLYEFNIYFGDPELTSIKVTALDASNQLLSTSDWCTTTYKSDGSSPSTTLGPMTKSANDVTCTAIVASHNYDAWRIRFGETTLSQATKIVLEMNRFNASSSSGDGLFFFVSGTCRPDTDGDGIPNDKDNDSDGDGCPDALEGGANFLYSNLDISGRLNTTVDAQGLPLMTGVPQSKGTSANSALFDEQSACAFPESYSVTLSQPGMPATLELATTPLQGSDEADQPEQGSWEGKKVVVTSLPSNGFDLIYNGTSVVQNQVIYPYVSNLLSIRPGSGTSNGTTSTSFQYSTIDIADQQDQTPASFTITWAEALLPLKLGDFLAFYNTECKPEFRWTSEDEEDFAGFTIEKSEDGKSFTALANIEGKDGKMNEYVYTTAAFISEQYFRLRMQDLDGTITYSKIIFIRNNCISEKVIRVFPVPLGNVFTITGLEAGDRIMVYNAIGYEVINDMNISGMSKIVNVSSLPNGIYTIRVISKKGVSQTKKLVK